MKNLRIVVPGRVFAARPVFEIGTATSNFLR